MCSTARSAPSTPTARCCSSPSSRATCPTSTSASSSTGPHRGGPLPRYRIGYVNLPVATDPVALDVRVEPDREQAIPGETVRYDVHVTDSEGRGVAAEVSVAIVDEAVLSLAAEVGPDGLGAFWSERSLGVRTAWSRAPAERQGGGDSDMHPPSVATAPSRRELRSVAGRRASAPTSGTRHCGWVSSRPMRMAGPASSWNSPTTRRRGGPRRGPSPPRRRSAEGESELLVTQPLLVRPALPRFLRVGDRGDRCARSSGTALRRHADLSGDDRGGGRGPRRETPRSRRRSSQATPSSSPGPPAPSPRAPPPSASARPPPAATATRSS